MHFRSRAIPPARTLAVLGLVLLLLAGCSPFGGQNVNDLLRAPALGGGQTEIQKALVDYLDGEEPHFKYPKKGAQRSPLLRADLDGDGAEEAVLLYSMPETSVAARQKGKNVYIAVLQQTNGAWQVVQDVRGEYTDVESLEAVDLLDDGTIQLIVGYASATFSEKMLFLYTYGEGTLGTVYSVPYSRYEIADFTGRGGLDLLMACPTEEMGKLALQYLPVVDGRFAPELMQEPVKLEMNMTACAGLYPGESRTGERLLVVDGETEARSIFSQIVYYSGERFWTRPGEYITGTTARNSRLLRTRDIDGDGAPEIPVYAARGEINTPANDKTLAYVKWMDYTTDPGADPVQKQFGLLDADRSTYIQLPDDWQGAVNVVDGDGVGEWRIQRRKTLATLLSVRIIEQGQSPPMGAVRIPGAVNSYLVLGSGLSEAEREQINMTALDTGD